LKPPLSLLESILLFLPLNYAICLVCSTLRRKDMRSILRQGTRFFISMTVGILIVSAVVLGVMEYALAH
jgi:hypothetical protein